jgi:two-component system, chemotaxis family, response regulator Rcp1
MDAVSPLGRRIEVLMVEDNYAEIRLMQEAFRGINGAVHLNYASDGVEALEFLNQEGAHAQAPRPDLILLDLNLPKMGGHEVLAYIKGDGDLKLIPTIILTSSDMESDVIKSYELHANCHLRKPTELETFQHLVASIDNFWLTKVRLIQPSETPPSPNH